MKIGNGSGNADGFVWNAAAGLVNAAEAVVLLMVVGRTNGLSDAGILTLAFAAGNLLSAVGRYGVRNYQVTDLGGRFCFTAYYSHRILSSALMGICTVVYTAACFLGKGYSLYKTAAVFLVCMIYLVESMEDVCWGLYQRNGRLDLGAKIFIARWMLHLFLTSAALAATKNLVFSLFVGLAGRAVYSYCVNKRYVPVFAGRPDFRPSLAIPVFRTCFPLFLSAFLTTYVANAPKYAIDRYLPESVQACYGYVAMPVFVVSLFNSFFYQPVLLKLTEDWKQGRIERFCRRMFVQLLLIVLLTAVCLAGGAVLGVPVLSFLYHTDLSSYRTELLILLCGGGFLAAAGFLGVILTIMRMQRKIMYGYAGTAAAACLASGYAVREYGVRGAACLYAVCMACLACYFALCVKRCYILAAGTPDEGRRSGLRFRLQNGKNP